MALSRCLLGGVAIAAMLTMSCKDKPAETSSVDAAANAPAVATTAAPMATTTPAASASAAHADPAAAHGGHGGKHAGGHHGPGMMLFNAAHALELKAEQKAKVEAAEKTAQAASDDSTKDAMKDASKQLHADLATSIKAGKIEPAKLEPRYAALEKVASAAHAKEAEALSALHGALDATQRKAVVANIRAKHAAHDAKADDKHAAKTGSPKDHAAAHGPDAHGKDGGAGPHGQNNMVAHLTKDLGLDADQQKKIDAIVAKEEAATKAAGHHADMKKTMDALLTAFEKDAFDAKKIIPVDGKKARAHMEHETKILSQIVPILTPPQREKLAAKMEKGPSPHGPGHGGGHAMADDDDDDDN